MQRYHVVLTQDASESQASVRSVIKSMEQMAMPRHVDTSKLKYGLIGIDLEDDQDVEALRALPQVEGVEADGKMRAI